MLLTHSDYSDLKEDQHFYIRLFNLRSGDRNEYLCGKGDISDDAYVVTADIHHEPAPSYSIAALDVELEDLAPPRYSVTAREILSALKANKNLRRPSWFHYGESDSESTDSSDDDKFVDALSQIGSDTDTDEFDDVFEMSTKKTSNDLECIQIMETVLSQNEIVTNKASFSSLGQLSLKHENCKKNFRSRPSVEFSSEPSLRLHAHFEESSLDRENDSHYQNKTYSVTPISCKIPERSHLKLVCPSMATVMILDDDHHGIFSLSERSVCLTETVGIHYVLIIRCGGSRGRVAVSYRTEEGTAKPNRDYQHCQGEIIFEEGETEYSDYACTFV